MITIGKITLSSPLILAPIAGYTDRIFRKICIKHGCALTVTELISAEGIVRNDRKTNLMLSFSDDERPLAIQIFGNKPDVMGDAAAKVALLQPDIIDINMGCPVRKIAKAGAGAKLLANEALTADILETVTKSVDIPVTVKIRIGLLPGQNVAPEIIKIAYETGIKMIAVHARPASQGHSGEPDIEAFAAACDGAKIPVVANGGIVDELSAEKFYKIPGCSGLMIGRGAVGNYSLFKRIENYFSNGIILNAPSWHEKIEWFKKHAGLAARHYGEEKGYVLLRKVSHYYVKDLPNAAKVRNMFNKVTKTADFEEVIKCIELMIND